MLYQLTWCTPQYRWESLFKRTNIVQQAGQESLKSCRQQHALQSRTQTAPRSIVHTAHEYAQQYILIVVVHNATPPRLYSAAGFLDNRDSDNAERCVYSTERFPPREPTNQLIGCLRFTKFCWVGKHVSITVKPTNSPTQGQPNPTINGLKMAFGPLFPTATNNIFSWAGIGFM